MKYRKVENGYLLCFELGEEIIQEFTDFCSEQNICAGFFHGIGGVTNAVIGYYDLEQKEYVFQETNDVVEIISLNGNIAEKDGEVFIHAHGALGNRNLEVIAGHIKRLTVGGTTEIFLQHFKEPIKRLPDEDTGLSLLAP